MDVTLYPQLESELTLERDLLAEFWALADAFGAASLAGLEATRLACDLG